MLDSWFPDTEKIDYFKLICIQIREKPIGKCYDQSLKNGYLLLWAGKCPQFHNTLSSLVSRILDNFHPSYPIPSKQGICLYFHIGFRKRKKKSPTRKTICHIQKGTLRTNVTSLSKFIALKTTTEAEKNS